MGKTRGVYHRRKHNLQGYYPKGTEQQLCLSFMYGEETLMRVIVRNQSLCTRAGVWAYAKELLDQTDIKPMFSILNKEEFLMFSAIDRFNNGGVANVIDVNTEKQLKTVIDMLVTAYGSVEKTDEKEEQLVFVDENGRPLSEEEIAMLQNYPQPSEEEIMIAYQ